LKSFVGLRGIIRGGMMMNYHRVIEGLIVCLVIVVIFAVIIGAGVAVWLLLSPVTFWEKLATLILSFFASVFVAIIVILLAMSG